MKERLYHVVSIRDGVKTYMTRMPCTHKEGCTIMSKITPYKWRTLMLEEITMLNDCEFYREIGRQAAKARNQKDEARAKFHAEYFRKARALEKEEFRILVGQIYVDAYKEFRNIPPVEYFK